MKQQVKLTTAPCRNCNNISKKKDFKSMTISGNKVLKCKNCDYYNSPSIFIGYKDIEKQELIFGQPIK